MFTDKIEPIIYNWVQNICGKYPISKVIGTISWSWTYDEGQLDTNKLSNVLDITYSLVNILRATTLAESNKRIMSDHGY